MGKRIERTGTDLKLYTLGQCTKLLMGLPFAARAGVVTCLLELVAGEREPPKPDPSTVKQTDLFQ